MLDFIKVIAFGMKGSFPDSGKRVENLLTNVNLATKSCGWGFGSCNVFFFSLIIFNFTHGLNNVTYAFYFSTILKVKVNY